MSRRVVLMTGASGQLGRALLPRLFARWPQAELHLLVRARGRHTAQQRFDASRLFLPSSPNLFCVEGALEEAHFGLDPASWAELCERVTHVLHLGGPSQLGTPAHVAEAPLRAGAASVLELARHAHDAGQLRRVDMTSCTLVAGAGALGFDEESAPSLAGHVHALTALRAEVEAWLRAEAGDLPLVVHRLGLMAPAKSTLLAGLAHAPRGLTPHRLDVAPLEQVASALTDLLDADESALRTTHIAAGSARAVPAPRALLPALAAVLTHRPPLRFSSFAYLKHSYASALYQDRDWAGWDDARPLLALLRQPAAEVSTARTDALLASLGHAPPGFG